MQIADVDQVGTIAGECKLSFWSRDDYIEHIKNRDGVSLIVGNSSEKPVGFIIARLITSFCNNLLSSGNIFECKYKCKGELERECEAEIYNIAVSPGFQCKGAGAFLLNNFVELFANCAKINIWLEVRRSNVRAVKFYEAHGFNVSHARTNYYAAPAEDALVMNRANNPGEQRAIEF